jgi:hypothetical protein
VTEEEILITKVYIRRVLSERMEKSFVGQSMSEVTTHVVKAYLEGVLKDLLLQGTLPSVVELVEWNVRFEGNTMHVVMEPKKGLDDYDHRRAVNFLFNQGDD